jgi:hypothetical protein
MGSENESQSGSLEKEIENEKGIAFRWERKGVRLLDREPSAKTKTFK